MIPNNIEIVFNFVEYLHSKIDLLNSFNSDFDRLTALRKEKNSITKGNNYKRDLRHNQLEKEIDNLIANIDNELIKPLNDKAIQLKFYAFNKVPQEFWFKVNAEKEQLKSNVSNETIELVEKIKTKYIELRENSRIYYFMAFFIGDVEQYVFKNLFKYFDDEGNNVLEKFNPKILPRKIEQPHQIEEKQKEVFTFENNFDGIPPEDVYNHFKAGLVDKKHIDLKTLETFLKQAFEDYEEGEPLKGKLKMNNTTNSLNFIIRVFHKYYSKQVSKHGKKSKYVKLLTDNFIDFDYQKTHDNFRS